MLLVLILISEFTRGLKLGVGLQLVEAFQSSSFVDSRAWSNKGGVVSNNGNKGFGFVHPINGHYRAFFKSCNALSTFHRDTRLQVTQQKETNNPNLGLSSRSSDGDYAAGGNSNLFYDEEGGYYYDAEGYYDEEGNYYLFDDGDAQEYYYDPKTGEQLAVYYDENGYAYDKNGYITEDVETFYDYGQGVEATSNSNGYSINGASSSRSSGMGYNNGRQSWPGVAADVEDPPLNKRLAIGVALLSVVLGVGVNLSGDLLQSLEDTMSQSFDPNTQGRNERIVKGPNGEQILNGERKDDVDQLRAIMKGLGSEAKHLREGADNSVMKVVDSFVSQDGISSIVDKIEDQGEAALKQLEKIFEKMGGTSKYGADGGGIFGPNGLFSKEELSHLKDSVEAHGDKLRGHVETFIQGLGSVSSTPSEVGGNVKVVEPPKPAATHETKTDSSTSTTEKVANDNLVGGATSSTSTSSAVKAGSANDVTSSVLPQGQSKVTDIGTTSSNEGSKSAAVSAKPETSKMQDVSGVEAKTMPKPELATKNSVETKAQAEGTTSAANPPVKVNEVLKEEKATTKSAEDKGSSLSSSVLKQDEKSVEKVEKSKENTATSTAAENKVEIKPGTKSISDGTPTSPSAKGEQPSVSVPIAPSPKLEVKSPETSAITSDKQAPLAEKTETKSVQPSASKESPTPIESASLAPKSEQKVSAPHAATLESVTKSESSTPAVKKDDKTTSTKTSETSTTVVEAIASISPVKEKAAPSTPSAKVEQIPEKNVKVDEAAANVQNEKKSSTEKQAVPTSGTSIKTSEVTDSTEKASDGKFSTKPEGTSSSPKNEGNPSVGKAEGAVTSIKLDSALSDAKSEDTKQPTNAGGASSSSTTSMDVSASKQSQIAAPPSAGSPSATKEEKVPEVKQEIKATAGEVSEKDPSPKSEVSPSLKTDDKAPALSTSTGATAQPTKDQTSSSSASVEVKSAAVQNEETPSKSDSKKPTSSIKETTSSPPIGTKSDQASKSVATQSDAVIASTTFTSESTSPPFMARSNANRDIDTKQRIRAVIAAMEKANFVGSNGVDDPWQSSSANRFPNFFHNNNHRYSTNWINDLVTTALMPSEIDLGDEGEAALHENVLRSVESHEDVQVREQPDALHEYLGETVAMTNEESKEEHTSDIVDESNSREVALDEGRSESFAELRAEIETESEGIATTKVESPRADIQNQMDEPYAKTTLHKESYAFVPDAVSPNFGVAHNRQESSQDEAITEFTEANNNLDPVHAPESAANDFHENSDVLVVKNEKDEDVSLEIVADVNSVSREELTLEKNEDLPEESRATPEYLASNDQDVIKSFSDSISEGKIPPTEGESASVDSDVKQVASRDESHLLPGEAHTGQDYHQETRIAEDEFLPSSAEKDVGTVVAIETSEPTLQATESHTGEESISLSLESDVRQSLDEILPPSREVLSVPEVKEAISSINDHVTAALDVSMRETASGIERDNNLDQQVAFIAKSLIEGARQQVPATDYNVENASSALLAAQAAIHSISEPMNEL